jgi:hypothetical protein
LIENSFNKWILGSFIVLTPIGFIAFYKDDFIKLAPQKPAVEKPKHLNTKEDHSKVSHDLNTKEDDLKKSNPFKESIQKSNTIPFIQYVLRFVGRSGTTISGGQRL